MKRFLATLMVVAMMISTMVVGTVPAAAAETDDAASKYVTLEGDWHYNLYRKYSQMFQYFAFSAAIANGNLLEGGHPEWPEKETWESWEVLSMPNEDNSLGGLHDNTIFPTWSESWVIREFDLPEDFTDDEYVTLMMGIIDDNDVVYINGTPVAAGGFIDGNGNPTLKIPEVGGFNYGAADKADQVKWETSYWERQREYSIPADVLIEGGTNVIGVRVFNNNSNSGFYSGEGKIYAICGNDSAVRALKGLPSQLVDSPAIMNAVAAQNDALAAADIEAYAETISDNYHNDADTKEDKLAEIEAMMDAYSDITVVDEKAAVYMDDEGGYWYTANRTITGVAGEAEEAEVISSGAIETCFLSNGEERGNWNRCYGTSYDSELFSQELTYSVYLPPSYYANEDKEYPVVWLLHGQNSSSTSYRDVDGIGSFMDNLIAEGEIVEMVLIMPDSGKNAFYRDGEIQSDINQGGPWRTQLTEELRAEAQANYRIMTEAEFNGLTGNSMGAYGSIMAGTTRPDLYSSIGLHMGFLPADAQNSLKTLIEEQGLDAYDFYVDCGLQDQTVGTGGTIAIHNILVEAGKEHGYSLRDGTHGSAFYMSGMGASMKMHSDHFMKNGLFEDDADNFVTLDGEWNYKLYRTYANMFQYFAYSAAMAAGNWTDAETALYPADGAWKDWTALQMPNDNPELGGLLDNELSPTWSEAWVVREFDLPMDFANSEEVTLLMGIIDDNDVIYINGTPVASSGFVDGNGNPTLNIPEAGGFNYDRNAAAEDQVKWSKSYWEIQREYTIPADVLNLGGTNEIAIRLYNNNSNGGFYSGNLYAICGNELAVRNVKGLPIEKVNSSAVMDAVEAQIAAIEGGDVEAFAATVADDYHNDAAVKADRVAEAETLVAAGAVTIEDANAVIYKDDEGNFWYSAERTVSIDGAPNTQNIELCYKVSGGVAKEIGNWNRCYGTSYASELFGEDLTYSVYLPPSYYTSTKDYPVVWLLHGRASSSTSYRDVDDIGAFMDAQIASGNIVEMVLIMPDSGKYAFYEDSELKPGDKDNSGPWRTQLTEELRGVAQEAYRIKKEAKFNGLTGNSMGAYGSIMAGTTRPDLYSSIGLHMGHLPEAALNSLKALNDEHGLAGYDFYLDCGLQDQTVGTGGTIAVHEYLESVGKAHGYELRDGTHGSAFYMAGMPASMKMHSDHFKANGLFPAPSGGGGGSSTPTYSTSVEKTENGSVSLSGKNVAAGKEVTINVKPDAGYELKGLTVTDAKGNKIEVVEKNGKLVFVMPDSKVTIDAEFVEIGKECAADKFDDLDADAWYHDAVDYVLENGIMTGVAEDKFAPATALTRGMVVQMLWAMEGKPAVDDALTFADVAADAWYAEAVRWAAAEGIVSGYSAEKFGPNDAVTREQMAVMLYGYARYKGADLSAGENTNILSYTDASSISDWAFAGLQWACGEGILSGKTGGYLDPTGTATRMEAAQMLMKFGAVLAD